MSNEEKLIEQNAVLIKQNDTQIRQTAAQIKQGKMLLKLLGNKKTETKTVADAQVSFVKSLYKRKKK